MARLYSSTTALPAELPTHMCAPSNAMPDGWSPTAKVPSVAPAGDSSVTSLLPLLVTHMFVPSNAIPDGWLPTAKVPSVAPAGDSSVTSLLPSLATHMFVPSNAIPDGWLPTAKVPSVAPAGDSSVTLLPAKLVTHMFVPSNAIPAGLGAHGEGAERRARRRQLGDVVAAARRPTCSCRRTRSRAGALPVAKVPSVAPAGDSSVTSPLPLLATHMFVPSNAIPHGPAPATKVPSAAPAGDSSVTLPSPRSATHMLVPSNAIPNGWPTAKAPSGPQVGGLGVQAARVFLQAPGAREATGARGARQRWAAGGQTLQGPIAQSLFSWHAPPELAELAVLDELDELPELVVLDELPELDVLDVLPELDVLDVLAELAELAVLDEPPAPVAPRVPVLPPPQAATVTRERTRETRTGRAGTIAA